MGTLTRNLDFSRSVWRIRSKCREPSGKTSARLRMRSVGSQRKGASSYQPWERTVCRRLKGEGRASVSRVPEARDLGRQAERSATIGSRRIAWIVRGRMLARVDAQSPPRIRWALFSGAPIPLLWEARSLFWRTLA